MTNIQKYDSIFMDIFELTNEELDGDCVVKNIQKWDSIGHITLISQIEDVFDIMMDAEDIMAFDSYEGGKKMLSKYGVEL